MSEWYPIAKAKKDGTSMLGFFPSKAGYVADQRYIPMHWSEWGGGVWECTCSGHKLFDLPTHFMLLPAPPAEEQ